MGETKRVMSYLEGVPLPADKKMCIEFAEKKGAPRDIVEALEKLPDQRYTDMNDVLLAVGSVA